MDTPHRLAQRANEVDARIAAFDAALAELRTDRSSDVADDEHDPEGVTLSSEWSRIAGLREDAVRERAELDLALIRMAEGRYGTCLDCGETIPAARLEARPLATRCVACAERAGR